MKTFRHIVKWFFLPAVLATGFLLTWFTWNLTSRKLSDDALEQARLVARSIDIKRVLRLKGDKTDLNSPDYLRIKEQLLGIRKAHRTCRFLYLMGRGKDGTVFFFLDSQPPDSSDYAPPGLVYEEVSDEYLVTFNTGKERTVGPIKDRWGTLVTSLIPINTRDTGKMLAVLGMDIEAADWRNEIIGQCLLPVSLTVFIVLLAFSLFVLSQKRNQIKSQYEEKIRIAAEREEALKQVKTLQGLFPICANCKKIRDDQGYWNQIDDYFSQHSEARFSHGLCPECRKELYGDLDLDEKDES